MAKKLYKEINGNSFIKKYLNIAVDKSIFMPKPLSKKSTSVYMQSFDDVYFSPDITTVVGKCHIEDSNCIYCMVHIIR